MKSKTTKRFAAAFALAATTAILGTGAAHAAGGKGASECSAAGNPATDPNPGLMIREHQPFGGIGNGGGNPGFAGAFSVCKP